MEFAYNEVQCAICTTTAFLTLFVLRFKVEFEIKLDHFSDHRTRGFRHITLVFYLRRLNCEKYNSPFFGKVMA